jgi:hypothetical protein
MAVAAAVARGRAAVAADLASGILAEAKTAGNQKQEIETGRPVGAALRVFKRRRARM